MMRPLSPKKISLYIAAGSSGLSAIIVHFAGTSVVYTVLSTAALFLAVYFGVWFFLSFYISEKIRPLYRALHDTRITNKELRNNIKDNSFIDQVKNNVANWTSDKTREIDQLKQLEKYRREFLGNVSHELKTPIFNIQGYILTLLDGGLEDPAINRLYLERAERSINRMISIVEDLEAISRLESGELKLELEDFNIVHLVYDAFEMQEMLAQKHEIKLIFNKYYDKPIKVRADKKRITEVVNNLVVNSIKYGKKGGVTTVGFHDIDDRIMIEVSDTGIGIAEKDQLRIFERFYRTDKSRSRDQGGTGLGLSIVKHIIEAHEQSITVRSKPGEGSVFTFTLNKA